VTPAVRQARIEESAVALGRTWAEGRRQHLHLEGRPVCGGWPGTLSEARARVWQMFGGARDWHPVTEAEREQAARAVYRSARDEWRRHALPERS
jgi:hypothetical protein